MVVNGRHEGSTGLLLEVKLPYSENHLDFGNVSEAAFDICSVRQQAGVILRAWCSEVTL